MVQPSPRANISWAICFGGLVGVGGLALLDEPGVLSKAAGVEVERDAVTFADGSYGFGVFHGDGLAAAGVVGDGEHDQRDALAPHALDELVERFNIHVAFEGQDGLGAARFWVEQIDGLGAHEFNIGAGGVEVGVVGDDVALPAHHVEEDALGGATLVCGDDVPCSR
jgi:hypothetical protein